ncbi:unnamed protein product [Blepharisma stoltei]|uniref:Odorant receptor n=1 Tax=Blepharisma stoltei TaxID=1481888 RepID=A0AAU9K4E1_9CILI|nr:unnamed protein product [Blepharisma stoltei]
MEGVEDMNYLKGTILADYDQWSYCESSEIVKEQIIPLWAFEPEPALTKHSLYDIVQKIINHGQSLILIAKSKGDYIPDFKFLVINCLTFTYNYVLRALESLVNCETDRINQMSQTIYAVMGIGYFSIVSCTLTLIYFIACIEKRYDEAWRFIRKKTSSSYHDLTDSIIKRLEEVHKTLTSKTFKKKARLKTKISIKSKIFQRYMLKISFFLVIASSFYFLSIFFLYPKVEINMKYRPLVLNHFVYKKSTLSRLGYFTRDKNDPRFLLHYPDSDALHNPNISYANTVSFLKSTLKDIRKKNYLNLMSDDLKSSVFGLQSSPVNNFMKYGSFYATNYLLLEADYIGNPTSAANIVVRYNFIKNYTALQAIIEHEYHMANNDSENHIYNELNIFAFVTLAYSLALLSLYFGYYFPYLKSEVKMIDKLNNLMAVIK